MEWNPEKILEFFLEKTATFLFGKMWFDRVNNFCLFTVAVIPPIAISHLFFKSLLRSEQDV